MKSQSQSDRILRHLVTGRSLTPLGALERFRCLRLAARVRELRDAGYRITTNTVKRNGKQYASYAMRAA